MNLPRRDGEVKMTRKKREQKKEKFEDIQSDQLASEVLSADELKSLQGERDDLLARLQRISADYLNYQKRVQRDIDQTRQFANEDLIKAVLCVIDDMERAIQAASENHDQDDPLLQGTKLVHDKLLETLGRFGLERIAAEGQQFDPDSHSAVMQEASADHPPKTVIRELQRGYKLKGRTIRPSAVVVSQSPEEVQEQADQQD